MRAIEKKLRRKRDRIVGVCEAGLVRAASERERTCIFRGRGDGPTEEDSRLSGLYSWEK